MKNDEEAPVLQQPKGTRNLGLPEYLGLCLES